MRLIDSGRRRMILASGLLCVAGALFTAASFVDYDDVPVRLDGERNNFDILVAGSIEPGWVPDAQWAQGNPDAYEIEIGDNPGGLLMHPGNAVDLRVAAKNGSTDLAALMQLSIVDPLPHGEATDPATGNYIELFDQLLFTVTDAETGAVLFDSVPAPSLTSYSFPAPIEAAGVTLLDVRIALPGSVDNRWQGASTDIQFFFEAVNS